MATGWHQITVKRWEADRGGSRGKISLDMQFLLECLNLSILSVC